MRTLPYGSREVAVEVGHRRLHAGAEATPRDRLVHPGTAALGFAGIEVEIELAEDLRAALDEAAALRATLTDERVLYLIWREPWMTIARDTYIAATLAEVGWHTLPAVEGGETGPARYPAFDWEAPWLADVARVLLSTEPYRFREAHLPEVEALARRPALLVDGEMVSWYGSRAARGLRWLIALRRGAA